MVQQVHDGQVVDVVDGSADGGFAVPDAVHDGRKKPTKPHRRRAKEPKGPKADWSFGTGLKTGAVRWGTVIVLLIGPVAAVANWVAPQQVAGVSASDLAAASQSTAQDSQLAAGAATSLVWAWWTATADSSSVLQPLVAGGVDGNQADQLPPNPPAPPRAVIVQSTTHATDTVWQVRVVVVDAAGAVTAYLVPVNVADGRGLALALPAQVPDNHTSGGSPVNTTDIDMNTPIAQTVTGFATALLTGGSAADVARWTSPGTTIAPVDGKPYTSLNLQALKLINISNIPPVANGTTVDVSASFIATRPEPSQSSKPGSSTTSDASGSGDGPVGGSTDQVSPEGATTALQYTLRLAARDGRWEVQAITTPTPRQPHR